MSLFDRYFYNNCSDRFRTTVNVLGDSFGVGIVQHYSRNQLAKDAPLTDSSTTTTPSHKSETMNLRITALWLNECTIAESYLTTNGY